MRAAGVDRVRRAEVLRVVRGTARFAAGCRVVVLVRLRALDLDSGATTLRAFSIPMVSRSFADRDLLRDLFWDLFWGLLDFPVTSPRYLLTGLELERRVFCFLGMGSPS